MGHKKSAKKEKSNKKLGNQTPEPQPINVYVTVPPAPRPQPDPNATWERRGSYTQLHNTELLAERVMDALASRIADRIVSSAKYAEKFEGIVESIAGELDDRLYTGEYDED